MCAGARVTDEDMALVRDLCSGFSQTEVIPEHLMDVVTAVSGSSPAYVFMFIEPWQMQQCWWNAETAGVQICSTGGTWKCKDGS